MKNLTVLTLSLFTSLSTAFADNTVKTVSQVAEAVTLSDDVDYHITSDTPFTTSGSVNIKNTDHAVLVFDKLKPSLALKQLGFVTINGEAAKNGVNCQVKIYNRGAIIMPYAADIKPLTVYSEPNFKGESVNDFGLENTGGFMNTLQMLNSTTAYKALSSSVVIWLLSLLAKRDMAIADALLLIRQT